MTLGRKLGRLRSAGPGARTARALPPLAFEEVATQAPQVACESALPNTPLRREMNERVEAIRRRLDALTRKHRSEQEGAAQRAPARELDARSVDDARLDAPLHSEVDGSELAGALLGETIDTPIGRLHRVSKRLRPSHVQGSTPIALALEASATDFARIALDSALEDVDLARGLYFDTETTGLSGGCGTLAFLIGFAWFEERALRVEQLVLRQPGEEAPMLERLRERISEASCLISYNGKSFDWPLLRTRYVMNRLEPPELPPHLDLLHCARRVFKARLDQVSLTSVEEGVLGLGRVDDVAGGKIPEAYSRFLAGAPGAVLNPVIEHNGHDLVSLAALLGDLASRYRCDPSVECASDQLGLARTALKAKDLASARLLAERATQTSETARMAHHLAARVAKAEGEWNVAASQLECARCAPGDAPSQAELSLELSKLYEHKLRDLKRALRHAQRARGAESDEAHLRRLERLRRRAKDHRRSRRRRRSKLESEDSLFVHPALLSAGESDTDPARRTLAPA